MNVFGRLYIFTASTVRLKYAITHLWTKKSFLSFNRLERNESTQNLLLNLLFLLTLFSVQIVIYMMKLISELLEAL